MPNAALPEYQLFAIRYATRDAQRRDHFIGGDPHEGPMPMDYFMWVAVHDGRAVVVDTGFREEVAIRRKRTFLRCPVEALRLRSEEHTSELQSLMRISYAVFCLKKKRHQQHYSNNYDMNIDSIDS